MAELGLTAYRFSIALGPGASRRHAAQVNQAGLDFYQRLVDRLLERGIQPVVTLYHWDLPAALDDRGGWLNPDIADWFADYAEVMFRALGRPGAALDHAQRAVGGHRRRLPPRRARAGPPEPLRDADREPQSPPRARRGRAGLPCGRRRTGSAWW